MGRAGARGPLLARRPSVPGEGVQAVVPRLRRVALGLAGTALTRTRRRCEGASGVERGETLSELLQLALKLALLALSLTLVALELAIKLLGLSVGLPFSLLGFPL